MILSAYKSKWSDYFLIFLQVANVGFFFILKCAFQLISILVYAMQAPFPLVIFQFSLKAVTKS